MQADHTERQVVVYTPPATDRPATRDLLVLEMQEWAPYCGVVTRVRLMRYLRDYFVGELRGDGSYVYCCGNGDMGIVIYAYPAHPAVTYQLRATVGELTPPEWHVRAERQSVSFAMGRTAGLSRPATGIMAARWLTGPWTTGGVAVAAPALSVSGRTVHSPIPLYGTVELTLEVSCWRHVLRIGAEEAQTALLVGWAEYVVGLPSGGRPVALEIDEPPGAAEAARMGGLCGRGRGGSTGNIEMPEEEDDEPPEASGANKHTRCDYCSLGVDCEED